MIRDRNRTQSLQDYLDGFLSPAERVRVERRVRESADWRREHERLRTVHTLLDTPLDVDPPADLLPGIFAALAAQASRRQRWRIPARLENGFVLAGALSLAAVTFGAARLLPTDPASWLGRLAVAATAALGRATDAVVGYAGSVAQLDWIARLVTTLVQATGTALSSSAQPLIAVTLVTFALAATVTYVLMQTGRNPRQGGVHVGLLA
jgi:anti-sigma factor RsiW